MSEKNWLRFTVAGILLSATLCLACGSVVAQRGRSEDRGKEERGLSCNDNWGGDRASNCVIKEQTVAAAGGTITVESRKNGGGTGEGWDRRQILVRAKIQTWAAHRAGAHARE